MLTEMGLGTLSKSYMVCSYKYAIKSEASGNKSCCLMFIRSMVYFEKKFVLSLWTSYSDNDAFKIIILSQRLDILNGTAH